METSPRQPDIGDISTVTRCDLSPGDGLPEDEEEASPSCWGGFCRKGPRRSAADKALLKAQYKLYKTQVRVHQIIQELWRDTAAVNAAKKLKEEEEKKKKEWSAGAGDHKKVSKWPFGNGWRRNRNSSHKVSRPGTTAQAAMDRDAPVALVDESMATSMTMSNSSMTIHLAGTGSGNSSISSISSSDCRSSSDSSSGYPSQSESSKCLADSSVINSSDDGSLHSDPCTPLPLKLVTIYLCSVC
ncbi:uncharacterized protein LOC142929323 [Petromyzon marinus]|uniref:uncharacterized protein LOC142929323 n=1 Tax=Petromyzon marinus TaxID=7757 RepID=UPI003F72D90E